MKIIAADDEEMMLEELVECIKYVRPKAEVYAYTNPLKLIKECNYKVDVAFLDNEMGTMSGMEVANILKNINPQINIIFVTGYSEYAKDAFNIRASGYVVKPVSKQKIEQELDNLRNPINEEPLKKLTARCFGEFELFVDGEPLRFERTKTKEMLAYLIECRGSVVTASRLSAVLWEDSQDDMKEKRYLQKLKQDLIKTLENAGCYGIFKTGYNRYSIDQQKILCDYYDFLDDKPNAIEAFNGKYMSQYSWGESTLAELSNMYYIKEERWFTYD